MSKIAFSPRQKVKWRFNNDRGGSDARLEIGCSGVTGTIGGASTF